MVALFAGLAMVAGVLTVTQLASSALEERNGGLGASECETTAPPEETDDNEAPEEGAAEEGAAEEGAAEEGAEGGEEAAGETEGGETEGGETEGEAAEGEAAEDPAADGLTTTDELEAHVVTDADGFQHVHYRRYGWRGWDRERGWDRGRGHGWHRPAPGVTEPPAECEEPGEEPTTDPGGEPTGEPTTDPGEPGEEPTTDPGEEPGEEPTTDPGEEPDPGQNQFDVFGRTCAENSANLEIHNGAQSENAQCVETQMGAVPALGNSPSLTITDAPAQVAVGEPFSILVSTRNLVRDFFPPAGQSGYYRVNAFLNEQGLISGHFHTSCNLIADPSVPLTPDQLINPEFFVATEDGGGGAQPDTVEVSVANGLPTPGTYRCNSWVGAASHALPMLGFARMTPAFDVVRIEVTG